MELIAWPDSEHVFVLQALPFEICGYFIITVSLNFWTLIVTRNSE